MRRMILMRRLSQISSLLFFIYVLWPTTYPLAGIVKPDILFKLDPLLMIIASVSGRILLPGIIFSFCMIALTILLGRFFCGWICPLGSMIDIARLFKKKRRGLSDGANVAVRKIKFYILGIIFIFAFLGKEIASIFDPIVIMGKFVSLNLIPVLTSGINYFSYAAIIFLVFLAICAASLVLQRFWCRVLCPLGAGYALFAKVSPLRRTVEKCTKCGRCKSLCRTGAIKDDMDYVQSECILCMDCVYDCPAHTTRFKWGKSR